MSALFCRLFLLIVLVLGTSLAALTVEASPALRLMPNVRAKMKGQSRMHRPIYRTYRSYRSF